MDFYKAPEIIPSGWPGDSTDEELPSPKTPASTFQVLLLLKSAHAPQCSTLQGTMGLGGAVTPSVHHVTLHGCYFLPFCIKAAFQLPM